MYKFISALFTIFALCTRASASEAITLEQRIIAAIKTGQYSQAIELVKHSDYSCAEKDFSTGELVLQGWVDQKAQQRPLESIATGIHLLEKSAIAGHQQAISSLAGLFYTGLIDETGKIWLAADTLLQACWEQAKAKPIQAHNCAAMRLAAQPK